MPAPEAKLIRDHREKRELSRREAARRAGISEGSWRRSEGDRDVVRTAETIARMAMAVGVTPAELVAAGRADAAGLLHLRLVDRVSAEPGLPEAIGAQALGPGSGGPDGWDGLLGQIVQSLDDIAADPMLPSSAKKELRAEFISGLTRDARERARQIDAIRRIK